MPAARQNSESYIMSLAVVSEEKMKVKLHNPKGIKNVNPNSLKSDTDLFILMVYITFRKEEQIIIKNNIFSYISV
jgi:hypothetical protein